MKDERDGWIKLIIDELPSVVKPLFSLSVFFIVFLIVGNNLKLNDSLWLVTKEDVINLAFYSGFFSLIFRAIYKGPLELRKSNFPRKYSINKLNKDYFLGKYDTDKVFVFELTEEKRKLWIANLETKRYLWGDIIPRQLEVDNSEISFNGIKVDLSKYPRYQEEDGKIDILSPEREDSFKLVFISFYIIIIILIIFQIRLLLNTFISSM